MGTLAYGLDLDFGCSGYEIVTPRLTRPMLLPRVHIEAYGVEDRCQLHEADEPSVTKCQKTSRLSPSVQLRKYSAKSENIGSRTSQLTDLRD
jgi:hypothetical protein